MIDKQKLDLYAPWHVEGLNKWWARVYPVEWSLILWGIHNGFLPLDDFLTIWERRRSRPRDRNAVLPMLWRKLGIGVSNLHHRDRPSWIDDV